ncbi:hypothetical protein Ancab_001422 [Ancistrocladus abbreviatus]
MKKLFFFRSSTSSSESNKSNPPSTTDKQGYWGNPLESELDQSRKRAEYSSQSSRKSSLYKAQVPASERYYLDSSAGLRRSHSFSSAAAIFGNGLGQGSLSPLSDQSSSPSSSSSFQTQKYNHSSRCHTLTPEKHTKTKRFEAVSTVNDHGKGRPFSCSSKAYQDSSDSSSSVSNKVLDRYIDGEQHQERSRQKSNTSQGNHPIHGGGKRPPRIHCTAPASPIASIKDKPRSHSFRGSTGVQRYSSPSEWVEGGCGQESLQKFTKHVVERLSQSSCVSSNENTKDFDPDVPITIEDVYGGPLHKSFLIKSKGIDRKGFSSGEIYGFHSKDYSSINGNISSDLNFVEAEDELDVELKSKFKEVEERILLLSQELEQENFVRDIEFNVPALVQRIRNLVEDKLSLALEVSATIQSYIVERASLKEETRMAKVELDSQTQRLEKEKTELQTALEKELDRRSSEWSFKLEKYQAEERRLRERVRELAEQNVSFQREVSSFKEKETERRLSEKQINDLTAMMEMTRVENQNLQQHISELREKYKGAEENIDCIKRNFEEKEEECKELYRSVTRLLRTCSEQQKTIDGLRGLGEAIQEKHPVEDSDKRVQQLQIEQIRLTGVEQALRREVESLKLEVDSLRRENINLLNRLKGCGKEGGSLTFKLDQELLTSVHCLQRLGLPLLNESTDLSSKLLEFIKGRADQNVDTKDHMEVNRNCLAGQFIVESELKIQGFRRRTESLMNTLRVISSTLQEKSNLVASESQSPREEGNELGSANDWRLQDLTISELRAEKLLTSLLREKLYAKDLEVEQLEAELATAVRGNDVLTCEVQNAMDSVSCLTHKMKGLELQMIKKDEMINQLQANLHECTKELSIARGILPKVTEERDLMWEEVKQYSEKNMLLNSEVNVLKKKIEALDEDILLKEGQITILKDTLGRPIDLLGSADCSNEF